jgi:outer membrane receptor protein involved in Fe transport
MNLGESDGRWRGVARAGLRGRVALRLASELGILFTAVILASGAGARAETDATEVGEVVVTASRVDLLGAAQTASQGSVTKEELRLRPAYRVGQLLESIPGLVVTIHSGEGKAPQYLLRGFNLDHGTDLADFVDDMPINRSTNAHGQGYSDLNFEIPEILDGLDFTKGPYYPAIGDFGAVGSVHQRLADDIPTQIDLSAGTLNDDRLFIGGTHHFDADNRLLGGFSFGHVDGPYTPADNFQKYAGALRFSHGDAADGYSLTALYYHGKGNFSTDQPLRAMQEGLIGRYGTLDPSDGTRNERYSLSGRYATQGKGWRLTINGYYIHGKQTLFNDFTHFLEDPVNGAQEQQDENRTTAGGGAALKLTKVFGGVESDTTFGVQGRFDDVYVDRRHTLKRVVLPYCEAAQLSGPATPYNVGLYACSSDRVRLGDEGPYVENATQWTSWLRTDIGLREEFYQAADHNLIPLPDGTLFAGSRSATLFQPKGGVVLGPWLSAEFYVSAGRGFHSDDARGVLQTVPIEGIPAAAGPTPLLVREDGEEIGLRANTVPHTQIQIAVFNIDAQSELIYDQDQGQDQASAPSNRKGVEFSSQYRPTPWLELNTDMSFSHARFTAKNLAAFGFSGPYIPNAPDFVGSVGALIDNLGPWYGGLQVRILGSYPLLSDNSARDAGYTETNLTVGYRASRTVRFQLDAFNLFDVKANAAAYDYVSRLPGEPAQGVADHQNHPLEPISGRFSMMVTF